jgi:branched-chain amino acid aminotransferase
LAADFVTLQKYLTMHSAEAIKITKAPTSKIGSIDFDKLPFGKFFTDHMLVADYANGEWGTPEIIPYGPISFDPSLVALHYGQSIFEGIKAYRLSDGSAAIFRPFQNHSRFNKSAHRMEMPNVPAEIFIGGMKKLLELEDAWIPSKKDHSMYIRPFMFGSDELLGVAASSRYRFMILLSPVGPYYASPMKIYVEEKYVRAVPGGVGFAKTAGNYAASLHPATVARKKGYDQVLWTDAFEHKYVQECGTMNVFFVLDGKLITPGLESGTILEGVTRDSTIVLARDMGLTVEEREISIDELAEGYRNGKLTEAFGAGTAATIAKIRELVYKDLVMEFNIDNQPVSDALGSAFNSLKSGQTPDKWGWMVPVKS